MAQIWKAIYAWLGCYWGLKWQDGGSAGCDLILPALASSKANAYRPPSSVPIVTVKNGSYQGLFSPEYNQDYFLGIPYAQKPGRFRLAEPLGSSWTDARPATVYPPHCVGNGQDMVGYPASEDCLYLNVIRPAGIDTSAGLPVAVWIHGGGLLSGGSADRRYNLSFLVQESVEQGSPILGVSLNYRLSAFGFLSGREALRAGIGNNGFRDQRLALRWIHENIAAFGGAPDKVVLWGESSGAESVQAQVFAYNGRDDGLFRGAIGQSGFGGYIGRYPGSMKATAIQQAIFDKLVASTACASAVPASGAVGTAAVNDSVLDCLRELPLAELDAVLSSGESYPDGANPWPPVVDGDFIADYPHNQLRDGRFVRVPLLIGTNSDEGTSLAAVFGPEGRGVSTDDELRAAVLQRFFGLDDKESRATAAVEKLVDELLLLYPDIQAIGVPDLERLPIIVANDSVARSSGLQFRRAAALFGDNFMHYARRRANLAWSAYKVPSWSYRFDVLVNGIEARFGACHFQEVAFVFCNVNGVGYKVNPFANMPATYAALAREMSSAWISFVTNLDPNSHLASSVGGVSWPMYNATAGGGLGHNMVWQANGSHMETDSFRAEGIKWMIDHSLDVFGV